MTSTYAKPRLLAADEPPPYTIERPDGASPFFLICDHAGRAIPRALGTLGLPESELARHIAWDIGARGTAAHLSTALDATLIAQTYSRLVIDCNRPLDSPTSITKRSERTDIPGNADVDARAAAMRAEAIFQPYHDAIVAALDARAAARRRTVLVSMHSFTPVFTDVPRPWHIGMLYHRDTRIARALLSMIRGEGRWVVGDNEPYAITDGSDYAIPVHGEQRGIAHVEVEIRQDLIADSSGQAEWAVRVGEWLKRLDLDALL